MHLLSLNDSSCPSSRQLTFFFKKKTGSFSLIPLERIKEAFPKNDDVYSNAREKRVRRREGADDERERESLKKTTCCS